MGELKRSKWDKFNDEILALANSGLTDTDIAKKILLKHNIPYVDSFRKRVAIVLKHGTKDSISSSLSPPANAKQNTKWDEAKEKAAWEYSGEKSITTLEEALEFSKVDLKQWEVERWVHNSWDVSSSSGKRTNHQVKVWFVKINEELEETLVDFYDNIKLQLKDRRVPRINIIGCAEHIGVVPIADIHLGSYIRELINTNDYDIEVAVDMLDKTAVMINKQRYSEVHLAIMGDIIESFTGMNHPNSFKSIGYGQYGFNIFITAFEILENFLGKINNLKKVYGVSGNHDRHSASNKLDTEGDVLKGIMYMLKRIPKLEVEYHPIAINAVIDGISYILTHGHLGFAKKAIEKIILDYGTPGIYNLVIQAHLHKRGVKRPVITNVETVVIDQADYRGIICPSFFTGNFFSEALGYTSTPGFLQFWNEDGKPAMLDLPLG